MNYLSNKMPHLTDQELSFKGSYTVSYFEPNVNRYVTAKYCSWTCFFHHAGINDVSLQDDVKSAAYRDGSIMMHHPETRKRACIYVD